MLFVIRRMLFIGRHTDTGLTIHRFANIFKRYLVNYKRQILSHRIFVDNVRIITTTKSVIVIIFLLFFSRFGCIVSADVSLYRRKWCNNLCKRTMYEPKVNGGCAIAIYTIILSPLSFFVSSFVGPSPSFRIE